MDATAFGGSVSRRTAAWPPRPWAPGKRRQRLSNRPDARSGRAELREGGRPRHRRCTGRGQGAVLMVAHADREALQRTLDTGEMHYRSRTRGPWHKGATSGNVQQVVTLLADCDGDAVLARVPPAGPACHTGARSCFGEQSLRPTWSARSMPRRGARDRVHPRARDGEAELHAPPARRSQPAPEEDRRGGGRIHHRVRGRRSASRDRGVRRLLYHALVALRATAAHPDVRGVLSSRVGAPRR